MMLRWISLVCSGRGRWLLPLVLVCGAWEVRREATLGAEYIDRTESVVMVADPRLASLMDHWVCGVAKVVVADHRWTGLERCVERDQVDLFFFFAEDLPPGSDIRMERIRNVGIECVGLFRSTRLPHSIWWNGLISDCEERLVRRFPEARQLIESRANRYRASHRGNMRSAQQSRRQITGDATL